MERKISEVRFQIYVLETTLVISKIASDAEEGADFGEGFAWAVAAVVEVVNVGEEGPVRGEGEFEVEGGVGFPDMGELAAAVGAGAVVGIVATEFEANSPWVCLVLEAEGRREVVVVVVARGVVGALAQAEAEGGGPMSGIVPRVFPAGGEAVLVLIEHGSG